MKKLIIYSAIILAGASSCTKDILEKTDFNGIDERVWNNEGTANLYLNRSYDLIMPIWPHMRGNTSLPTGIHFISDDLNNGDTKPLFGTLTIDQVSDFYGSGNPNNAYSYVRRVNTMLEEIDGGTLPANVRDGIKAQGYFLRAWVHFNLWKVYGGVPYITHPQDWLSENVLVPRNKSSECVDSMLNDLAKCSILPATWGSADAGRITSVAAQAVAGRILLYWASPLFNPNGIQERWERAYKVNRAAYDSLRLKGYELYTSYANVLTEKGAANKEPILIRSYNGTTTTSNTSNTWESVTRPYSETAGSGGASNQPTWNLVRSYPMKNGKMVDEAGSGYDSVYYWKDRDPRFDASIAYNGAVWALSGKAGRKQWNYTGVAEDKTRPSATGFYSRKAIPLGTLPANVTQGAGNWVELRLAEVMLNLAECANATGRISEAYDMLTAIRKRAGITAGSDNLYGLKANMSRTEMENAIMNERRIELAFEGKRNDDLRRTRRFHLLNGSFRQRLTITPKSPATAATLEAKDANGVMFRDKLNIDGEDYKTYFTAKVENLSSEQTINFLQNYYFYALPTTNIAKNPSMLQTKGWADGTFDPTE